MWCSTILGAGFARFLGYFGFFYSDLYKATGLGAPPLTPPSAPRLPKTRPRDELWKTCWGLRAAPAAAVCRSAAARAPARLRPPPLSALRGTCLRAVLAVAAIARVRRLKEQQGLAAPNPTRAAAMTAGSTMLTRVVACPQARATSCPPREPARRAMPQSPPRPDEDGRLTASS